MDWFTAAVLTGPRLRLDALRVEDSDDFLTALGDAETAGEVTRHLSYPAPESVQDVQALIAAAVADPHRVPYAQRLRSTGEFVGTTSCYDIDPTNRAVSIGHTWLAGPYWRSGLNSESKFLLLRRTFEDLGAERVVWQTDVLNTRSQAAIERLGAQREGILRHHRLRCDGSWRDTVTYAMVRAEWPVAKRRLIEGLPLEIRHEPERNRYLARFGDEQVAEIDYLPQGRVLYVTHTGTSSQWRRCGIAARVTRHALDDIRERDLRLRAGCSYTRRYLSEHPEYADLVG